MSKLSRECSPSPKPINTSCDKFDSKNQHIAISIKSAIATYGRLTYGLHAPFKNAWLRIMPKFRKRVLNRK
jgi:hypothetical protein